MWIERLINRIRTSRATTLVESEDGSLEYVAQAMLNDNASTMWLDVRALSDSDGSSLPDKLRRINWGLPVNSEVDSWQTAFSIQAQLAHTDVAKYFVVTGVQGVEPWLVNAIDSKLHATRIVVGCSARLRERYQQAIASDETISVIHSSELCISRSEASHLLGMEFTDVQWATIQEEKSDRYPIQSRRALEQLLAPYRGIPSPVDNSGKAVAIGPDARSLTQILKTSGKWLRAFRVAVQNGESIDGLIDRAGEEAVSVGSINSFQRLLQSLPTHVRGTEQVLFWLLFAASTLRNEMTIVREVMDHLSKHDAPQLRLLAASLGLISPFTNDSQIHHANLEPSMTLHYAHLLSVQGKPGRAVELLTPLTEQFLASGRPFRQLQAACLLANTQISAGSIEASSYWSGHAVQTAAEHGISDPHLYAVARGLKLYALVLLGRMSEAAAYVEDDIDKRGYLGLPSMEAVFTSNADYFMIAGDPDKAASLYEKVFEGFSSRVSVTALPDYVMCLIELGRQSDATRIAQQAFEHWSGDTGQSALWATLALGIALAVHSPIVAGSLLEQVVRHNESQLNAPQLCRATIHLARIKQTAGHLSEALEILASADKPLAELAETGWTLFGGSSPSVLALRQAWLDAKEPIVLKFLGSSEWSYRTTHMAGRRGVRLKEILLALCLYPSGLVGEKLYDLLGGETGSTLTLRSHIRNLRQYVPVGTAPYRLLAPVKADFLDMEQQLAEGNVVQALESYKGPVLPESDLGFVRDYSANLEALLRAAIEQTGDNELLTRFALQIGDDLSLLEQALLGEPSNSPTRVLIKTRIDQVRKNWER